MKTAVFSLALIPLAASILALIYYYIGVSIVVMSALALAIAAIVVFMVLLVGMVFEKNIMLLETRGIRVNEKLVADYYHTTNTALLEGFAAAILATLAAASGEPAAAVLGLASAAAALATIVVVAQGVLIIRDAAQRYASPSRVRP